jgi:hypothetical protein
VSPITLIVGISVGLTHSSADATRATIKAATSVAAYKLCMQAGLAF